MRKTLSADAVKAKANFDLQITGNLNNWTVIRSLLVNLDAYNGYTAYYSTDHLRETLMQFPEAGHFTEEIHSLCARHANTLSRAQDIYYARTGICVDETGENADSIREQFVQLEADNFIYLR
jgi:hypothetical protein